MALLNRPEGLRVSPVAPAQLEVILKRIQLVDVNTLRRYEKTDPQKVGQIVKSLRQTNVLVNPIIVDTEREILVDGHHRVQAFKVVGLARIPAFTVDYLSNDLTVKGWSHATDAPASDLKELLDDIRKLRDAPSAVIGAGARCDEFAGRGFATARESAQFQNRMDQILRRNKHIVSHRTESEVLQLGINQSYIRPVIGKEDVLEMIESRELFPPEVNRHLIKDRPLNMRAPLNTLQNEADLNRHLDTICHTTEPMAVPSGSYDGERLYEEPITLFS